ncbi:manganese catalase family protein [Halalkalibacterium ligniniphilum]|uniref:manganese catalase family protein n=1 Tax=Halalkalibacterium ligniniphilum TaxID=1134413 RepID=UPI00034B010E|nr:manganese catalase family protein [Halalkalibacterium ligniniphilum]
MFKRIDKLIIDLPKPDHPDANAAAAVQELLGGRFGEMSTLNNYMYQSFNFRNKKKLRPFYELVASITAEEFGHVELVSNTINLMIEGTTFPGDPDISPMQDAKDKRNTYHFIATAQTAYPMDSMGASWRGDYVVSSGNLIFDLLHNFFLEVGARTHKMRVYEMTNHPVAREMIGYLLVRGGVHIIAYAKALEIATGVDMTKMLPIPDLSNRKFDAARKFEEQGLHRKLYTWSDTDYKKITQIWKGEHPTEGGLLEVVPGTPEGGPIPNLQELPEEFAPGISEEDFLEIAKRLQRSAGL